MNTINGKKFTELVEGARNFLELNKEMVDSLNVFPVPDGDTGTNISLTMNSTVKEMKALPEDAPLKDVAKAFSSGALKGARGNSGVIMSQIFMGMSEVISENKVINTKIFACSLQNGADKAYDAVTKPKEGTILTVIRVVGDYAAKISVKTYDFIEFFQKILKKGEEILAETPEMLPVLKQAGVVDAGGKGLIVLLTGMYNVLAGIEMKAPESDEGKIKNPTQSFFTADIHDLENIEFAYCTEFFVINLRKSATIADIDRLRDKLMEIGDCVVVVGDLNLVKVHVHTNRPDKALGYALSLGELDKPKVENMLEQNRAIKAQRQHQKKKKQGYLAICAGDGNAKTFKELIADEVLEGGNTMNPSVSDIVEAANKIPAETVFVLPNNKNIILAAEQAKELTEPKLVVIATKTIPEGISAAISFDPEADVEENTRNMQRAASSIRSASVTVAVKNVDLDGFQIKEGDIIGIEKEIIEVGDDCNKVAEEVVAHLMSDESLVVSLYYGSEDVISQEKAEELQARLNEKYPETDILIFYGGQPFYHYFIAVE